MWPRYEHRSQPLLPVRHFVRRVGAHVLVAIALLLVALVIGVVGYRVTADLPWIDALLNASMILGGMGPVDELHGAAAKVFASAYALFSGVVFLVVAGTILAPAVHRLLHTIHIED
jgi:hypothetical protein